MVALEIFCIAREWQYVPHVWTGAAICLSPDILWVCLRCAPAYTVMCENKWVLLTMTFLCAKATEFCRLQDVPWCSSCIALLLTLSCFSMLQMLMMDKVLDQRLWLPLLELLFLWVSTFLLDLEGELLRSALRAWHGLENPETCLESQFENYSHPHSSKATRNVYFLLFLCSSGDWFIVHGRIPHLEKLETEKHKKHELW